MNLKNTASNRSSLSATTKTPLYLAEQYNGWVSRDLIDFYERYCRVLFERYGHRVKYWLTFNEINSVLHLPFMSGGINTPKEQLTVSKTSTKQFIMSLSPQRALPVLPVSSPLTPRLAA